MAEFFSGNARYADRSTHDLLLMLNARAGELNDGCTLDDFEGIPCKCAGNDHEHKAHERG